MPFLSSGQTRTGAPGVSSGTPLYLPNNGTSIAGVASINGATGIVSLSASDTALTVGGSGGSITLGTTGNAIPCASVTASGNVGAVTLSSSGLASLNSVASVGNVGAATLSSSGLATLASATVSGAFNAYTDPAFGSGLIVGSETIAGAIPDATTVQLTGLNAVLASAPVREFGRCVFISAQATPETPYVNGLIVASVGASLPAYQSGTGNSGVLITGANQSGVANINVTTTGAAGARLTSFSFTNGSGIASTSAGVKYYWVIV